MSLINFSKPQCKQPLLFCFCYLLTTVKSFISVSDPMDLKDEKLQKSVSSHIQKYTKSQQQQQNFLILLLKLHKCVEWKSKSKEFQM